MSRSVSIALEVLPLEGEPPAARPARGARPRSRRWTRAVVSATIVSGLLVPVRANVAGGQFRRLAHVWAAAGALEPARIPAIDQLEQVSVADDQTHAAHGTAEVEEREAVRLLTLRRQLDGWLVPDPGLERLWSLMRKTMSRQVADLRAAAAALRRKAAAPTSPYGASAVAEAATVHRQIDELRRRFGQSPAAASARIALRGAEADLAALHRYLDQPTGTVLVTADGSRRLSLLDLDRSRTSTLDLGSDTSATPMVTRRGFVAVLADTPAAGLVLATDPATDPAAGLVLATDPNTDPATDPAADLAADPAAHGPPRVLAREATSITPAVDSDRLWVATNQQAIEVEGGATVVAGPIPIPPNAALAGATSSALYTPRARAASSW